MLRLYRQVKRKMGSLFSSGSGSTGTTTTGSSSTGTSGTSITNPFSTLSSTTTTPTNPLQTYGQNQLSQNDQLLQIQQALMNLGGTGQYSGIGQPGNTANLQQIMQALLGTTT